MAITIKNKAGLFLTNDGFNSYCFTSNKELAHEFNDAESAEKLKSKLMTKGFTGLTVDTPDTPMVLQDIS